MYMAKPKIGIDFWRILQIYKQLDDCKRWVFVKWKNYSNWVLSNFA